MCNDYKIILLEKGLGYKRKNIRGDTGFLFMQDLHVHVLFLSVIFFLI